MKKTVFVKDIMTKRVVAVSPETSLAEASKMISDHNFDGVPVVDKENHLVGILTEYDLITKTSSLNVSFLQKIINDVYSSEDDMAESKEEKNLIQMQVRDLMNTEPLCLKENATFDQVIEAFIAHHRVNPIPIVDENHKLVGVVSRFDVLRPLNLLGYRNQKK